jgi:hypothetical protein
MKRIVSVLLLALSFSAALLAQASPAPAPDPFKDLTFLEQNWEANTNGFGGVKSIGNYTFRRELDGHILARRATTAIACKGPQDFDCGHGDMLYVFQDAPGQPLKAIYFDNEGHVIHYTVTTPAPQSVVFLSEPGPGPQFRLSYEVKQGTEVKGPLLVGKFQMRMPGQTDWKSYLEWSGPRH